MTPLLTPEEVASLSPRLILKTLIFFGWLASVAKPSNYAYSPVIAFTRIFHVPDTKLIVPTAPVL